MEHSRALYSEPVQEQETNMIPNQAMYDSAGNKLRLQGYYNASSFPSVPDMPVGGLPSAPDSDFAEHDKYTNRERQQESEKTEEMLIQF